MRDFDENKLKPGQRLAALRLVENDFAPVRERRQIADIAEEVGVASGTISSWNNRDSNFIAYKNSLAREMMDSFLPMVYSRLLGLVAAGNVKGIEMYLKRMGELDSKQEVVVREGRSEEQTIEDRRKELLARIQRKAEDEGGE